MRNLVIAFALSLIALAAIGSLQVQAGQEPVYGWACDASAAVPIGERHLLMAEDEGQLLRLYPVDGGAPLADFNLAYFLNQPDGEIDLEGGTRIGQRVYWITSHGRNKDGERKKARYRFFATDILGSGPHDFRVQPVGKPYTQLVQDMLNEDSWEKPDPALLQLLGKATRLDEKEVPELAPKKSGLNIEGLAASPSGDRLWIGLRNPLADGSAILVPLLNPEQIVQDGKTHARFGVPVRLPLQNRGIRSIEYSPSRKSFLIVAGPVGDGSDFLFAEWSGPCENLTTTDFQAQEGVNPEAVVVWPNKYEAYLLFDEGSRKVDGTDCKDLKKAAKKSFRGNAHILNEPTPE